MTPYFCPFAVYSTTTITRSESESDGVSVNCVWLPSVPVKASDTLPLKWEGCTAALLPKMASI